MKNWFGSRPGGLLPRLLTSAAGLLVAGLAHAANADGEVLLKLRSAEVLAPLSQKHRLSVLGALGARPIYRVRIAAGASLDASLTALRADPDVLIAEANTLQQAPEAAVGSHPWAIGTPDGYAAQWAGAALQLPQAQALASGRGVTVAVLDTGVDFNHPALAGRLKAGWDFVDGDTDASETGGPTDAAWGHGTHVAGLVAMAAPGATIWPLRVLDASGQGSSWAIAEALLYAVDPDGNPATADGAQVINLSLGTSSRTDWMRVIENLVTCTAPDGGDAAGNLADPGFNDDKARCDLSGGPVVVAGAGNLGNAKRFYPAAESVYGLVSVAATNAAGTLATFSNFGKWITLAAPGEQVTSPMPGGLYASWSGTSMAAPLAAGAAALVRSTGARMSAEDIKRCMESTSLPLPGTELRALNAGNLLRAVIRDPRSCR